MSNFTAQAFNGFDIRQAKVLVSFVGYNKGLHSFYNCECELMNLLGLVNCTQGNTLLLRTNSLFQNFTEHVYWEIYGLGSCPSLHGHEACTLVAEVSVQFTLRVEDGN